MKTNPNTKKENIQELIKFTLVGGVSTAAHYLVLIILVEWLHSTALLATMLGYSVGALVNYYFNLRYTFKSNSSHSTAVPKFIIMVILGFAINAIVMYLMIYLVSLNYLISQLVATGAVYCWNFIIGKVWTFK